MGRPFVHPLRVRFGECDPQGVVFNAHYLAYLDLSMTELWRAAFGSYVAMTDRGFDIVVAEAQLRFRSSARFDDELSLAVAVEHLGNTSIITRHLISRNGEAVVEGMLRHVMVELETLVKTPIPDFLRNGLTPWLVPPEPADRSSDS
jgi:acyl-CoA thioester hydrolase